MTVPTKFYLFRRCNGVYYVGYFDEGRKRWKSTRSRRKADALKCITRFQELFRAKAIEVPLSHFTEQFLAHARATLSPKTVELYGRALNLLLTFAGDPALSSLTPQHIDAYKSRRLAGHSPVSVNMELRALKAALNAAVRWRQLESNPFQDLQPASVPDQPPAYITKVQFKQLMSVISETWLRELVVFAIATGMRQGEMLNLRWQEVDLSRRLVHIWSIGTFKTKQGCRRTIPMSNSLHELLGVKAAKQVGEFVFMRKGLRINASLLQHRFKFYLREAKLDERLHWHSLRHTHASWLVQGGSTLYEVQRLLGHSSSKVTEIYAHLQPEQLHSTVNRIKIAMN